MTLIRSVAHNTLIQIVGKAVSTVLGLAAVAVMTRSLGAEQFGWFATAAGFLQFVGILSDFGFTLTVSNLLAEPRFGKQQVMDTLFTWRLITSAAFQGLGPLVFWFLPYPAPVKLAVIITSLSFFAFALSSIFIGYFRERLNALAPATAEILGRIALFGGIAIAAYYRLGFLAMMAVISAASLFVVGYLWFKYGRVKLRIDKDVSRAMFKKMWPTALAVIFNAFYLQGDRVILPLFASATEVAWYGASYRVLDLMLQIAAMVMGLVMPLLTFAWSRNLAAEFKQRYQLGFDLMCLIVLPMAFGAMAIGSQILRLVGGIEFAPAGFTLALLSISVVGTCFGMIFGHVALAVNRQKQVLWIYATDAILSVVGYLIFIPRFGTVGAIGVTIFSEWYAGVLLALATIYYAKVFPRLFNLAKISLASVIMAILVYYLTKELNAIFSVAIGGAIYLALISALRVISRGTIKSVLALKSDEPVATPAQV